MSKRKINIVVDEGFDNDYLDFLNIYYNVNVIRFKEVSSGSLFDKIDLLVFTGGADVDPIYYGERTGKYTHTNLRRDEIESNMFDMFYNVPKLGICRGSQFLCVKSGGKLIQHVNNHTSDHTIKIERGRFEPDLTYEMTSTHHQMMYPFNLDKNKYNIIGWSEYFRSNTYLNGNNEEIKVPDDFLESEIVYFKDTKSLAVQGHPEFKSVDENTKKKILSLINKYLINNNEN